LIKQFFVVTFSIALTVTNGKDDRQNIKNKSDDFELQQMQLNIKATKQ
jgi:hypothetical protein